MAALSSKPCRMGRAQRNPSEPADNTDRLQRLIAQAGHTAPEPETEDELLTLAQAGEGGSY